jgi:hypothetical protein
MATIVKVGSYTGNGAAQNISIGFIPDVVRIACITTPAEDVWYNGMTAGTSLTVTGTAAIRAAPNGVTAFAGTAALAGQGFTVGAGLSVNASVYRYTALQNGPGAA